MTPPDLDLDQAALVIDTLGRRCPIPVIELAKQIGAVEVGAVVAVLSDDEAAQVDIPAWCQMREQRYLGAIASPAGGRAYLVERLA